MLNDSRFPIDTIAGVVYQEKKEKGEGFAR